MLCVFITIVFSDKLLSLFTPDFFKKYIHVVLFDTSTYATVFAVNHTYAGSFLLFLYCLFNDTNCKDMTM